MPKLIHGDCIEEMQRLRHEGVKVDLVLTDPPYGTTACKWDNVIPFADMWDCLNSLIKPNTPIALFSSQPFTSVLVSSNLKMFKYSWVWNKKKPGNIMLGKVQPMKITEDINIFGGKKCSYNPIMEDQKPRTGKTYGIGKTMGGANYGDLRQYRQKYPKNIIEVSNANQKGKVHPTQKPVALLEYLIKTYTNEGETVLDFTMGSGSTGVACKNLGRDFIGIEKEEKYFKIAKERIEGKG